MHVRPDREPLVGGMRCVVEVIRVNHRVHRFEPDETTFEYAPSRGKARWQWVDARTRERAREPHPVHARLRRHSPVY